MDTKFDVIVVGGGHAGCEAAAAAANMGSKTLLITMDMTKFAFMSCNPAMGGVAKGQIVREIDALGGYSGIVSDYSAIQFRMLNRSKGPAMWSPRTQNDRTLFTLKWRELLEETPNLTFWQDSVIDLILDDNKVERVKTGLGISFQAKAVVLTTGTFMNGLIHVGAKQIGGGRMGEKASTGLTEKLLEAGFETGRMKTGTPPRIDGQTLDYSKMEIQDGDEDIQPFSFLQPSSLKRQRPCHITYTNPSVHEIIGESIDLSPMYNGTIQSTGPRYCPSIEDKIHRFASKERHQIFVEPEGWNTHEVYVNGFSTSLPLETQYKAIKHIPGFENARFYRPGYAIEYDYFKPTQLRHSLETKLINGLFFAGQINGTTGYEEAAAQGIIAGMNANLYVNEKPEFTLQRNQAYIAVLIDDLITKGTDEPYRMFTSRAEFRITLRQETADERLTPVSHETGLASKRRMTLVEQKIQQKETLHRLLGKTSITPQEVNNMLREKGESEIKQSLKIESLIQRPNLSLHDLIQASETLKEKIKAENIFDNVIQCTETEMKYAGYIDREYEMAQKMQSLDRIKIPENFNYLDHQSLSIESREKLNRIRPENLGEANRISGIKPSDISVLLVSIQKHVSHETA